MLYRVRHDVREIAQAPRLGDHRLPNTLHWTDIDRFARRVQPLLRRLLANSVGR